MGHVDNNFESFAEITEIRWGSPERPWLPMLLTLLMQRVS